MGASGVGVGRRRCAHPQHRQDRHTPAPPLHLLLLEEVPERLSLGAIDVDLGKERKLGALAVSKALDLRVAPRLLGAKLRTCRRGAVFLVELVCVCRWVGGWGRMGSE